MRAHLFLCAASLAFVLPVAHADSYRFAFGTPTSLFGGSGTLTTGVEEAPGEYLIATVTGTVTTPSSPAGIAIESILPIGTFPTITNGGSFPANDNTLFAFGTQGTLSQNGLSFLLTDGAQVNLYSNGSGDGELLTPATIQDVSANIVEDSPITITGVAPTPEPSSVALLGTGLLGGALVVKRRIFSRY